MYTQQCFFGTWKNSLNFTPQMRILDDNQHERLITKFMAPKKQKKRTDCLIYVPLLLAKFHALSEIMVSSLVRTTDVMGSLK